MRIGSVSLRLRTVASVGVLAVGIPAVALASVHHSAADTNLPAVGTAGTTVGSAVGSAVGSTSVNSAGNLGLSAPNLSGSTSASSNSGGTCTSPQGNLPANKVTVSASTARVDGPNQDVTVLEACMRTSNPADLVFSLSSECSIITTVATTGNENDEHAFGQVRMWVEIDGQNVGVIPNTQGLSDDGHVVFCNRAHSQSTSGFVFDNPTIRTGLATEEANAFNWVAMNVGSGIHDITVHAELTDNHTSNADAHEFIGDRTLVVDVTQTAQNMAG